MRSTSPVNVDSHLPKKERLHLRRHRRTRYFRAEVGNRQSRNFSFDPIVVKETTSHRSKRFGARVQLEFEVMALLQVGS